MTFLPIVERELRVASRRRGTYWNRTVAALSAILIFTGIFCFNRGTPRELGKDIFKVVSGLFLFSSLVAGVRYTADSLSEEKREGTLGLLFLTDLRGYDVVLGKLAATSLDALYGLIAIVPVLAIPLLLGGVSIEEFWRMTLVLVNALFFSLTAGMFVSAMSRDARKAMGGTLFVILLFNAVFPAIGAWLAYYEEYHTINSAFLLPSVWTSWGHAFDAEYRANPDEFRLPVALTIGLGCLFLALASVSVRNSWQDKPAGARMARWRLCWQRWSYGNAAERAAFRARLLNISPCFWLGGRQRLKPILVWAFLSVCGCLWLWGALAWKDGWLQEGTYFATAVFLHCALKWWITSVACQTFGPDHRSGALELLLSTPLPLPEILRGQMLALKRQFMWPVLAVVLVDFVFMVAGASRLASGGDSFWIWLCWAGIVTLVVDGYTLCWVGMWTGCVAKRPNRASSATIARVLVLPWGGLVGVVLLLSFTTLWRQLDDKFGAYFLLGLWFALGMIVDVYFCVRSRVRLLRDLRQVATERFAPGRRLGFSLKQRRKQPGPVLPPVVAGET